MKSRVTSTIRTTLFSVLALMLMAFSSPLSAQQTDTTSAKAPVVTQQPAPAQGQPGAELAGHGETPAQKLAPTNEPGGEANLVLPDLSSVQFLGMSGHNLLLIGLLFCAAGLIFGLMIYMHLKKLPVHRSMREISELIYETCKTYLITQGKFIAVLWIFIAIVIGLYFGVLAPTPGHPVGQTVTIILLFSIVGILGSYGVAWFGIRVNTFANSRTAFAGLGGKPYPIFAIPLEAGMSIGMLLISVELLIMLCILLFVPAYYAGPCFIGFAIGESLGAAALRIAGGIFTKIADIGADLMKIVFKIKEDDARNPGVIADCTGDNAGDSVGPSADGFETYGVTGVALITFILLAVKDPTAQVQLLVWIFAMRIMMLVSSAGAYFLNGIWAKAKYGKADEMNFEAPLTSLVWLTSIISIGLTFVVSSVMIPSLGGNTTLWWKLATIISCGTLAGAIIPEMVKIFTSVKSTHVKEVVTSSREGGPSLNILSGLVAGNFSAYWLGLTMVILMALGYTVSLHGLGGMLPNTMTPLMLAPAVFAFGLVAFGFLGMGPVTIAVDSYGPVTDNAQSVYELSLIEQVPNIEQELKRDFNVNVQFEKAKHMLEENDGAGNTFKASAKPVLIGTAVVGATTMIFSIIMALTNGLTVNTEYLSLLHAPFVLGLITGGAMIYWFTGASMQAVTTGAYRAVEFIKANINLESTEKASVKDSKKVVEICTKYAQKGMFNIFLAVFFATLAFAFVEPYFFIGYLISIAIFGLYQAIFMANAGGAWDNAKKIVEVELKQKGTPLHDATVVGDTVGDPFKDTSSVALNPVIKFTTLFGLLAVELAVKLTVETGPGISRVLALVFFLISATFVWRSFYRMRIGME
ncbi:MAG: sodium-translocating pyrophosphatase [Bacteroidota bacterium]|nr:sodium-translocating pyrophosphatase [Bacteroidota bacterium]MDP4232791.1 sodium-translocating pyrophosphatase [Bacteroidota bacterium]MDP4242528.1 sodium-translocating pyrophosphatase [Bacteroidota bacterium]MDP4288893.1 sodium-translocating pyrophosphatase [Bacteroidota bacterium]